MSKLKNWYKHVIRPRLILFPFVITWVLLLPLVFIQFNRKGSTRLCIEAGAKGWESIEYKELYQSAIEFLSIEAVVRVVVDKEKNYLQQLRASVRTEKPTHYVYDPRTGAQGYWSGLCQSFAVAWILRSSGVIPIVLLTDCAERVWRTQSAIVTAHAGTVITFISVKEIAPIFPHRRIVGPSLMPFSQATLNLLSSMKQLSHQVDHKTAVFVGSLYEPRTSKLKAIDDGLKQSGYSLQVKGRLPGMPRVPDSVYWETLVYSAIGFTTADQVESDKSDWTWIPHMVYRYLEVTAAGSLLIAPNVPGLERFFSADIHFSKFETVDDAIVTIRYYLEHPAERETLAKQGHARAAALINARVFWTSINAALGKDALL